MLVLLQNASSSQASPGHAGEFTALHQIHIWNTRSDKKGEGDEYHECLLRVCRYQCLPYLVSHWLCWSELSSPEMSLPYGTFSVDIISGRNAYRPMYYHRLLQQDAMCTQRTMTSDGEHSIDNYSSELASPGIIALRSGQLSS